MASIYKHGTYGEFADTISNVATQSGTVAVYVGTAPVNLVRGWKTADVVNAPVKLTDFASVKKLMGYSDDWTNFRLCEAFKVHFDNSAGNIGPIVAINVLDPDTHKKDSETTQQVTFTNGVATIKSTTIILDTLVLADKVEGVDYTIEYNWTAGQVVLTSIAEVPITGQVQATFSEIDHSKVTKEILIGGETAEGAYSGLAVVSRVYPELHMIPSLLAAPGASSSKDVYNAMLKAATKINGHWDAFVVADIPVSDTATIEKATKWASDNGYTSERSKVGWPEFELTFGGVAHWSTLYVWRQMMVDATHDGIPMETASNKAVPVAKQYFGASSTNRGFDQNRANELNAAGISTAVYWGGQWVLWGGHTAAYKSGAVTDARVIFDNTIRMMMYQSNEFQKDWALTIDGPMTKALADTIKNQEQAKADALVAVGALIGTPVVDFLESENSTGEMVEGNFVWNYKGTPTPQFKSGTMRVAYTDEGFSSFFGEEA